MEHGSGNQVPVVAGWRWSSLVVAFSYGCCRSQSEELRAYVATPYLPRSFGIDGITLPIGAVGKLPHYLSSCGLCPVVPMPFHIVAGAPVTAVSPSEFIPV